MPWDWASTCTGSATSVTTLQKPGKLPRVVHRVVHSIFDGSHYSSEEIDRLIKERLAQEKGIYDVDEDALQQAEPDLLLTQELCAE